MVVLASEIALVLVLYCTREFPPCDSLFKSQRVYFLGYLWSRYQYGPFLYFLLLQKLCGITWLLTGWKKSLLPEAPLSPEARGICPICHMVNPAANVNKKGTQHRAKTSANAMPFFPFCSSGGSTVFGKSFPYPAMVKNRSILSRIQMLRGSGSPQKSNHL